tara:strand:+ start:840 stop:1007 length:168 start_codon:yes stop_codon:yes gene_type:complete
MFSARLSRAFAIFSRWACEAPKLAQVRFFSFFEYPATSFLSLTSLSYLTFFREKN